MRVSPLTFLVLAGLAVSTSAQLFTLCYTNQYCEGNIYKIGEEYLTPESCYAGCIEANPDYGYFDWYARTGGQEPVGSCWCGFECQGLSDDVGTDTYAIAPNACFGAPTPAPTPSLTPAPTSSCMAGVPLNALAPKVSRRSIRARSSKPVGATYTLRVKGKAKSTRLANMGVTVTLPAGVAVAKTPASSKHVGGTKVTVSGNQVTWYPVAFTGTKTKKFSLRVTMSPPFAANAPKVFSAVVFQDSNGAMADYCPLPVPDATVTIAA